MGSAVSGPVNFTVFHGHVLQMQTREPPARVSRRRRRALARAAGGPLPSRRHRWRSASAARPALAQAAAWCLPGHLLLRDGGPSARPQSTAARGDRVCRLRSRLLFDFIFFDDLYQIFYLKVLFISDSLCLLLNPAVDVFEQTDF